MVTAADLNVVDVLDVLLIQLDLIYPIFVLLVDLLDVQTLIGQLLVTLSGIVVCKVKTMVVTLDT
jgi:hypothetical protein